MSCNVKNCSDAEIQFLQKSDLTIVLDRAFNELYRLRPQNPVLFLSKWLTRESRARELAKKYLDEEQKRNRLEQKFFQEEKRKKAENAKKEEQINSRKKDEDNLIQEIRDCKDFWLGFNHICERLKGLINATGCYVGIYDLKRRPVMEDDDETGHIDPSNSKVLRYIGWNNDHNFLDGKYLEQNQGVTFDLIFPQQKNQQQEGENNPNQNAQEQKPPEAQQVNEKKENNKTMNNKNNHPTAKETHKNIKNPPNQATHKIKIHPQHQATQKKINPQINQVTHKIIAQTNNKESDNFQIKMLKEINKSNIGKNIMISPLSIYHILSLTTNGAENKTLREMLQALCQRNKIELNKNNAIISSSIGKLKSIELANAIFTKFKPLDNFMKIIKDYKATIDKLIDESQINKWCSDSTHQKIPQIIDNLTDNDLMVLINAIYFKGFWQEKFDKKLTNENEFMNYNKEPQRVDFMHITKKFDYYEDKELQAISLNYQKDHLKALIILPNHTVDINTYIKNFTIEQYTKILKKLVNINVVFILSKF